MFHPDLPSRDYVALQRSKIHIGDSCGSGWETTYNSSMRPFTSTSQQQKIDTVKLQKTHWTNGNLPTTALSESHANFCGYKEEAKRRPSYTRDQMMKTSFALGNDRDAFTRREVADARPQKIQTRSDFGEKMRATHFELTTPVASRWETTTASSFRPINAKPSEPQDLELRKGSGARSCFEQMGAYELPKSSNQDSYANLAKARPETAIEKPVYIDNDSIVFGGGKHRSNQRASVKLGGIPTTYSTSMNDGFFKENQVIAEDPAIARQKKAKFTRSSLMPSKNSIAPVLVSTMKEHLVAHPGCTRPPESEKTAFISHLKFANKSENMTTSTSSAFYEKKAEVREPFNMGLQKSHCNIGYESLNKSRSLYDESYQKPLYSRETVNSDKLRVFHTSHHSRVDAGGEIFKNKTTYSESFHGYPNFLPPLSCDSLKGANNVIPDEEKFVVRQSNMKESYQQYKKTEPVIRSDNSLQRSHLQLKSICPKWTTTQQDYFLFKNYKTKDGILV